MVLEDIQEEQSAFLSSKYTSYALEPRADTRLFDGEYALDGLPLMLLT